jgi:hypothetical protein
MKLSERVARLREKIAERDREPINIILPDWALVGPGGEDIPYIDEPLGPAVGGIRVVRRRAVIQPAPPGAHPSKPENAPQPRRTPRDLPSESDL